MTHTLGEIWEIFSGRDGHSGKSTDQQESAHYTLFSRFPGRDTNTGQSTDQQGYDAHTGKNLSSFLSKSWAGWEINTSTGICAQCLIFLLPASIAHQQINKEMTHTLGKNWEISRAEMFILVNQQINRNLRAIPYFSVFWSLNWNWVINISTRIWRTHW